MDGTILDTIQDIHDCLIDTMKHFKKPLFTIDKTTAYVGNGMKMLVTRALGGENNYSEEIEMYFRSIYNERLLQSTTVYEGMEETLSYLKLNSIKIAVISNKAHEMTVNISKLSGLDIYFDAVYGGDFFPEKKPSPIPVLETIKQFAVTPEETLFIGDNYTDIESGNSAGCKTCFCTYGYGKLSQVKPDFQIDSPQDIQKLLEA